MDQEVFATRLAAAAEAARTFSQPRIVEHLPAPLVFRVQLNQSYDGHPPRPEERRFEEDSAPHRAAALNKCNAETAVATLWRDGYVPEWINVAVADETGTSTVIELVCCGRFTNDDAWLYHVQEGIPPFHVLGPTLPPRDDGEPFSIHLRAECWDESDLAHLRSAAGDIWSFELQTEAFDGQSLSALPDMPNMEIFQHRACALAERGLSTFSRFPKLRMLRLHLTDTFHIDSDGDSLDALADLTITNLPPKPWGHSSIGTVAPSLASAHFHAAGALWLDGAFGPSVRSVDLTATEIAGHPQLPSRLDSLTIRLTHATDQDVVTLLDGVTHVEALTLRGTPVTDAVIPALERYGLRHLDLVDTAVTAAALARFHAEHPEVNLLPRPHPHQASDLTVWTSPL
jgi:hypothetical protein